MGGEGKGRDGRGGRIVMGGGGGVGGSNIEKEYASIHRCHFGGKTNLLSSFYNNFFSETV